jgi:hypothetical protein
LPVLTRISLRRKSSAGIDRDVPVGAVDQQAEMQMILDFVMVAAWLELRLGHHLGFDKSVSERHDGPPPAFSLSIRRYLM